MAITVKPITGLQKTDAGHATWNADSIIFNVDLIETWFQTGPFLKESLGGLGSTMATITPAAAFGVTVPVNNNFAATVSGTGIISLTGTTRMSTAVQFATGATGGMTFTGDTDTSITRTASNELTITTGGIGTLVINASQNVGIGTTTPGARLDVVGSVRSISPTGPGSLFLDNGQTTPGAGTHSGNIFFRGQDAAGTTITTARLLALMDLDTVGAVDGSLLLYTTRAGMNTEAMRILPSGFVGINTTNPTATLDVNGDVRIRGAIQQAASGTLGVILNAIAGATASLQRWQYDGLTRGSFTTTATQNRLILNAADFGNDALGTQVRLERNTNSTSPGAGHLLVYMKGGAFRYLWPDDVGDWRSAGAQPVGTGDLGGIIVGLQGSQLAIKDLLQQWHDPFPALQAVLDTPIYDFQYKENENGIRKYQGEIFTGPVTDYSPHFGMDQNKVLNLSNITGYLTLSVQALHQLITPLIARIEQLEEA